jgi:hypothetical protein
MTKGRPKSPEPPDEPDTTEDEKTYTEGVLTRGEAAEEGEELEPGQTHEKVEDESGDTTVRRRRFSAF